ncbi:MAG: DUF3320 domain-containing protein, partial [Pseudonocardiaceae bacterium]
LGALGFPFDDARQTVGTLGRELTIVRNARAHGDSFTALDAWRAHDYCVRLLEHFADAEGLVRANELRQEAFTAYSAEEGLAPVPVVPPTPDPEPTSTVAKVSKVAIEADEQVTPDVAVYKRDAEPSAKAVGGDRLDFEPWEPVPVGDVSVLDDLPKKVAKEKVRAVAAVIVEAEGPIHVDRLASLIGASFGVRRLHASRAKKIIYQAGAAGIHIDADKFAWPDGVDPVTWTEFRPNTSDADRPFHKISPVEIANAMCFLREQTASLTDDELDVATLQTFGRKRRTTQITTHLASAWEWSMR